MAGYGQPEKFTAQQMIDALKKSHGMITFAADLLHCSQNTVRRYIDTYPTVAAAMEEFERHDGDAVELALIDEAINKRNATVLMFLARTKFKDRGYVERLDIYIRYEKILKQLDEAATEAGIGLADALNDFYAELVAAGGAARVTEDANAQSADERTLD
jgi:hypothetical protein